MTKVSLKSAAKTTKATKTTKSTAKADAFEKVAKSAKSKSAAKTDTKTTKTQTKKEPKVPATPPKAAKVKVDLEVTLTLAKETPGTYVFTTDADDAPVTQIYIKKSGMPKGAPKSITITIN